MAFPGEVFTLALFIGWLAGKNQSCTMNYSETINPDIVDDIVELLNEQGIDIYNQAEDRLIVFRARRDQPVAVTIDTRLGIQKNCLLMFGLSSGCEITIREAVNSADHFERILSRLCDGFRVRETKIIVKSDGRDPRRKVRVPEADFKREIHLAAGSSVKSGEIHTPSDLITGLALMTLAAMRKTDLVLPGMAINRVSHKFINYLKATGAEVEISDKSEKNGEILATVTISGKGIKAKKLSGEQTGILIDEIPFMAVAAILSEGTTIIRGIREYAELGIDPFEEIASKMERLGVKCGILKDGLIIEGIREIDGTDFGYFRNPKIALAFTVAAMAGQGHSTIANLEMVRSHYPGFSTLFDNMN
jgi:3-phosphoshikimate 1-carboxyvinyltransferase